MDVHDDVCYVCTIHVCMQCMYECLVYICIYECLVYMCVFVCMYVYIYMCVCVCMYVYVCFDDV